MEKQKSILNVNFLITGADVVLLYISCHNCLIISTPFTPVKCVQHCVNLEWYFGFILCITFCVCVFES